MNANKINERISKKSVNTVSAGVAREINGAKKALKTDRKSLRETLKYLSNAETPEAENVRNYIGLKKNASKKERENVAKLVLANSPYICNLTILVRGKELSAPAQFCGATPCRKNGKPYTDYLDAILDAVKVHNQVTAVRSEIARRMLVTRRALIARGDYLERVQNVLNNAILAPAKIKQVNFGDVYKHVKSL